MTIADNEDFKKNEAGKAFYWGVSTAAFQIEGAAAQHGKGPSIWDRFSHCKGKIHNSDVADIACDFYHRFPQDLALMRTMNIPNFRFSISWSRIFPDGIGSVNRAGVDYYNHLIDFCLELNIEPWITLYHWDLPLALERKGGWTNRDMLGWFENYASFCIKTFGDRVKKWMILNEPMVFTGAGYFLGIHAPGRKSPEAFFAAAHHATLCQALGADVLRSSRSGLSVGTTFSCSAIEPASQLPADVLAAKRMDALLNRLFIEPLLGLGYPVNDLKFLSRLEKYMMPGDENLLAFDMDFIGIQNYTREVVAHSWLVPYMQAKIVKADERGVKRTTMNWEIYPSAINTMLKQFAAYNRIRSIIVTENGSAFHDTVADGQVNDVERKEYLQSHIKEVLSARKDGVPVDGYFVWSFTDNFEWAEGYSQRFGIVHVDYTTQKRTVKSSGAWYKEFLSAQQNQVSNEIETSFINAASPADYEQPLNEGLKEEAIANLIKIEKKFQKI